MKTSKNCRVYLPEGSATKKRVAVDFCNPVF